MWRWRPFFGYDDWPFIIESPNPAILQSTWADSCSLRSCAHGILRRWNSFFCAQLIWLSSGALCTYRGVSPSTLPYADIIVPLICAPANVPILYSIHITPQSCSRQCQPSQTPQAPAFDARLLRLNRAPRKHRVLPLDMVTSQYLLFLSSCVPSMRLTTSF